MIRNFCEISDFDKVGRKNREYFLKKIQNFSEDQKLLKKIKMIDFLIKLE